AVPPPAGRARHGPADPAGPATRGVRRDAGGSGMNASEDTIQGRLNDLAVNVRSPAGGARGDGAADDAAAVQAAIDAAPDGSVVFFPPGVYLVSSSIVLTGRRRLALTGPGTIQLSGADAAVRIADGSTGNRVNGLHILGSGDGTGVEIAGKGSVRNIVEDCHLDAVACGVRVGSDPALQAVVRDCVISTTDVEGSIGVDLNSPDCKVFDNVIRGFESG